MTGEPIYLGLDSYTEYRYSWYIFPQGLEWLSEIFKNKGTEDINYGRATKEAFRTLPQELHRKAQIKNSRGWEAVTSMQDLQEIRGNRFEKLRGERKDQYSIRINEQYRICFEWEQETAADVEITDYH